MKKQIINIGIIIGLFLFGFILGKKTTSGTDTVTYVKGDTISIVNDSIQPVVVDSSYSVSEIATKTKIVYLDRIKVIRGDTVTVHDTTYVTEIDTAAVVADYLLKRFYEKTEYDNDTTGSLNWQAVVQYNKLQSLNIDVVPVSKIVQSGEKKQVITPFIYVGGWKDYLSAGGGIYIKNVGVGGEIINFDGKNYFGGKIFIKF